MSEYTLVPLVTIAYMCYCFSKSTNVLCKIVAAIFICSNLLLLLMRFVPYEILNGLESFLAYFMRISVLATGIFVFQLFKTGSEVKSRGEQGAEYNFIIATALILMIIVSFNNLFGYLDFQSFYEYRMRVWPEIAVVGTFAVMKIKAITLNQDEDKLLWYFAASALFVVINYFV